MATVVVTLPVTDDPTPSQALAARLAKAREAFGFTERGICRAAGIKSSTQIAAARTRGSPLNFDHVTALARVLLEQYGVSRDWLLWGEGKMVAGVVRDGPGTESLHARPVRPRQKRSEPSSSTDPRPVPSDKRRRV
jgi:hypothetical protein